MAFNLPRLTLYALLSGVEEDLRDLIEVHLTSEASAAEVLGQDLHQRCIDRLNQDAGAADRSPNLRTLLPYIDFADAYLVLNANRERMPLPIAKSIRALTPVFERLAAVRKRVMHFRPLMFDDLADTQLACEGLLAKSDAPWAHIRDIRSRLIAEPSFVLGLEIPISRQVERHNLPLPDFDDTGYLGRESLVADLTNHCLRGAYPVTTISGVGGLGKSALALKVAYDIADRVDNPFDSIVWITAKSAVLGAREVERIEGAIADSLSMLQAVADEVAGRGVAKDPFEEVLKYLAEFRILLVLDNLETVLDDRLKQFLRRLPAGSRVLITSRVSLGQLDYPVALKPLEPGESVELLRALAKARGLNRLVQQPHDKLAQYCDRMRHNPGWIKWFVTATVAGVRPEEALNQPDLFLDFCLSNVYGYFSSVSKRIARTLLGVPGRHSQGMLAFLADMESADAILQLQSGLEQLINTNMVTVYSVPRGTTYQTLYELGDLPREYLARHFPVNRAEQSEYTARVQRLNELGEQLGYAQQSDPYVISNIRLPTRSDLAIARSLVDAMSAITRKDWNAATDLVGRARALAPEYFEVHRIDALLREAQGDFAGARAAYEAAIDQEPNWGPLRFFFGSFLLRTYQDVDAAFQQFQLATSSDPKSIDLQLLIVRALVTARRYREAGALLIDLVGTAGSMSGAHRQAVHDAALDAWVQSATSAARQKNAPEILNSVLEAKAAFQLCPKEMRGANMRRRLRHACYAAVELSLDDPPRSEEALRLADWFASEAGALLPTATRETGHIIRLGPRRFGYIQRPKRTELYFHQGNMGIPSEFSLLRPNQAVTYSVSINKEGLVAVDIRPA
jgi:tetratricopeptide (TPR) repeat protein